MVAHFIVCRKCGQPGGTLHSISDVYEHDVCPKPQPVQPSGPWRLRSQSKLVIPQQGLVIVYPKLVKKGA